MSQDVQVPDPDDYFTETRMSFGEHIEDLRTHLFRALKWFLFCMIIAFFIGKPVLRFIAKPVEEQLAVFWNKYHDERREEMYKKMSEGTFNKKIRPIPLKLTININDLRKGAGLPAEKKDQPINLIPHLNRLMRYFGLEIPRDSKKVKDTDWITIRAELDNPIQTVQMISDVERNIHPPTLSTLSVQEAFVVFFKVCLLTGFVLSSPFVFYHIWSFVAAGLYPHEKKYVNYFLPFSLGLFLSGVFVCEIWVIPRAIEALLWFNDYLNFQPDLRLGEWLGFAIFMPLVFGLSFQTPLVMLFLQRVGIMTVDVFRSKRRIAWFTMAILAAVITPSTDAVTLMFLWIPMSCLYELGIALCIYLPGRPLLDFGDDDESDELIEV